MDSVRHTALEGPTCICYVGAEYDVVKQLKSIIVPIMKLQLLRSASQHRSKESRSRPTARAVEYKNALRSRAEMQCQFSYLLKKCLRVRRFCPQSDSRANEPLYTAVQALCCVCAIKEPGSLWMLGIRYSLATTGPFSLFKRFNLGR